jgi:NTP pyrophosphatase (non-canonical NTP hydrolase)
MTRDELVDKILSFRKARDWKQFHLSKNLAISLVLESSEVLELFQWTKNHRLPSESGAELQNELADVYYWLLLLAHEHKIDLDKALESKLKENERKYPIALSKGNAIKYNKRK